VLLPSLCEVPPVFQDPSSFPVPLPGLLHPRRLSRGVESFLGAGGIMHAMGSKRGVESFLGAGGIMHAMGSKRGEIRMQADVRAMRARVRGG